MEEMNKIRITKTAATIETLLGMQPGEEMDKPVTEVVKTAEKVFRGNRCERVFMYNPDAVAMWIYEKYKERFHEAEQRLTLRLPMLSVIPPVTPVCFASMYSGLLPEKHGIMKYEKPVLKVKTVFDDMLRENRRAAIVSTEGDSISKIFLGREMDYYIYPTKQECNRKALALIEEDAYELIVLYNGDYDYYMHRFTPEGKRPLRALDENLETCCKMYDAVEKHWKKHNSVVAFAPDHGCHRAYLLLGNHGINEPCDMNIMHFYGFLPASDR